MCALTSCATRKRSRETPISPASSSPMSRSSSSTHGSTAGKPKTRCSARSPTPPKAMHRSAKIDHIGVSAYTIPTDFPESDGTLEWNETTVVVVEARAGGRRGIGYTFADTATARLIADKLAPLVAGAEAMAVQGAWAAMVRAIRNLGRPGVASMAIAAVDIALWDLKARLLDLPLASLLGEVRDEIPIYGSGGFTSYSIQQIQEQFAGWAGDGIAMVKMKIGREPGN